MSNSCGSGSGVPASPPKVSSTESLGSALLKRQKRPSECDEEKSKRNFTIYFINPVLFGTHITEHKHARTRYGTLYANLSRVQPACVLSSVLSLQAQARLRRMVLSIQSDKLCRQSSIRTTSCWFLGRGLDLTALTDKEQWPSDSSKAVRATSLSPHSVLLQASL